MRKSRRKLKGVTEIEEDPLPEAETRPTASDAVHVKAEDAQCVVNVIAPPDGDPEGRLQQVLEILKQQERNLKRRCEDKIQVDTEAADKIREKLLKGMNELPKEFLDGPANEEALTNLQIPAPVNFPSCCHTKNSVSRRVIRVLSKDNGAAQTLAEWNKKFNEIYGPRGEILTGQESVKGE